MCWLLDNSLNFIISSIEKVISFASLLIDFIGSDWEILTILAVGVYILWLFSRSYFFILIRRISDELAKTKDDSVKDKPCLLILRIIYSERMLISKKDKDKINEVLKTEPSLKMPLNEFIKAVDGTKVKEVLNKIMEYQLEKEIIISSLPCWFVHFIGWIFIHIFKMHDFRTIRDLIWVSENIKTILKNDTENSSGELKRLLLRYKVNG